MVKVPPIDNSCSERPLKTTETAEQKRTKAIYPYLRGPFQLSFSVAQSNHDATKEHMLRTEPTKTLSSLPTLTFLRPQNVSVLYPALSHSLSFFASFPCWTGLLLGSQIWYQFSYHLVLYVVYFYSFVWFTFIASLLEVEKKVLNSYLGECESVCVRVY